MIKAIFLDVDGTLMSHNLGGVPKSTIEALQQAREKGVKIFIATGRQMTELENLPLWESSYDGYVTLNGQICLDKKKQVFYEELMNAEDAKATVALFNSHEVPMMMVEKERNYVNFINDLVAQTQKAISSPLPPVGEYEGGEIFQFVLYTDTEKRREVEEKLPGCRAVSWNPYAADVIPKDGDKTVGIQKMMELFRLSREEIIAFGDAENDIDMLKFAGIGVAMGNAFSILKEQADYVTDHIDKDGIWKALKHFQVI